MELLKKAFWIHICVLDSLGPTNICEFKWIFSLDFYFYHTGHIYTIAVLWEKKRKYLRGVYYILIKVRNEVKCLVILIVLHNTN